MNIRKKVLSDGAVSVPAVIVEPQVSRGQAVVVHGYGGCKEEVLGLAWRIAECGFVTTAIDLRGHGENPLPYDSRIRADVELAVRQRKAEGEVVAVGHSLGGRLCLISGADYKIGISPALARTYSENTQKLIRGMRSHRVREAHAGVNFDTLESLSVWEANDTDRALLMYCTQDIPEVVAACVQMKDKGARVERVDDARHPDVFLNEKTFATIRQQLNEWFG